MGKEGEIPIRRNLTDLRRKLHQKVKRRMARRSDKYSLPAFLNFFSFLTAAPCRGANPDFTSNELLYQLQTTKATVMIVHPDALATALDTARQAGLAEDRIILFDTTTITPDM